MRNYILFLSMTILIFSGCLDNLFGEVVYEKTPTTIEYRISYGYLINVSGNGKINITYTCPLPDAHKLQNLTIVGDYPHRKAKYGENEMIVWSFEEENAKSIKLGISADIISDAFLVDLSGCTALDIEDINQQLKEIYCRDEGIENKTLIQVENGEIKTIADKLRTSNNTFDVGKNIFVWLKTHTTYIYHQTEQKAPQSAVETLKLKTGDCDDLSILYISLCRSAGIPARLVKGYLIVEENDIYRAIPHAWAEIYTGMGKDGWIPIECAGISGNIDTEVHQNFGVEDAFHLRVYVDNGTNESLNLSFEELEVWYEKSLHLDIRPFLKVSDVHVMNYKNLVVKKNGERFYR